MRQILLAGPRSGSEDVASCHMRRAALLALGFAFASAPAVSAKSWVVQPTPNPPGVASSGFAAVSCGSDTSCIAVGSSQTSSGKLRALAERWDATTWTIQTLAPVRGAVQTYLQGVSCISPTWCTAVGVRINPGGKKRTLAEHWN